MGYSTWHTYGYGICVDDIGAVSVDRLQKVLDHAPIYHAEIKDYLQECGIEDPSFDDYTDYANEYNLGLAALLKEVILEAEGILFTACDDLSSFDYLVYTPSYPWDTPKAERALTEHDIRDVLCKYVSMLTDEAITIDYQEVENGG